MTYESPSENLVLLPTTLNRTQRYVNCRNRAMGWGKMGKGRAVTRCKTGCRHYRGIVTVDDVKNLVCAWTGPKWAAKQARTGIRE